MARALYDTEPTFRKALERCDELLRPHLPRPLLSVIYPAGGDGADLDQTCYSQPALYALEWALCELWRSWGVEPSAVMGHSVGEYVAACVAGVLGLEDALKLVAARGRLMQSLPAGGAMLAVEAGEARVAEAIAGLDAAEISIAAYNGPEAVVLSGTERAVDEVRARLGDVRTTRLAVSHAFHSPLVEPMLDDFEREAAAVRYSPPRIGLVSNLTGRLASADEVGQAGYWRRHARAAVRFASGVAALRDCGCGVFLEVGPASVLAGLGSACLPEAASRFLPSLRRDRDAGRQMLETLRELYVLGAAVDWVGFDRPHHRRKVSLPTYPFQRQRFWVEATRPAALPAHSSKPSAAGGVYEVAWLERPPAPRMPAHAPTAAAWLIFADAGGLALEVARRVRERGQRAVLLERGGLYERTAEDGFRLVPTDPDHLARVWRDVAEGPPIATVLHLWSLEAPEEPDLSSLGGAQAFGCVSALLTAQRLLEQKAGARLWLVTRGAQRVDEGDAIRVAQAPVWGLGRAVPLEHPEIWGGLVDLDPRSGTDEAELLVAQVDSDDREDQVAYRGGRRYVARLRRSDDAKAAAAPIAAEATYLITGGLGGLGLEVAATLAARGARDVVLAGRTGLPERREWDAVPAATPTGRQVAAVRALEAQGVRVRAVRADAADAARMASLFAELRESGPPLRGIVHAAGVLARRALRELTPDDLYEALRPKLAGAWVLHELSREAPLDFFVLFSSASAVWGSISLAHYAAANHFLDALAARRRAEGLPALSIAWGPWAQVGMATREEQRWLEQIGVQSLTLREGTATLMSLLGSGVVQATAAKVDWAAFGPVYEAKTRRRLLEDLGPGPAESTTPVRDAPRRVRDDLDRPEALLAYVRDEVARVLGLDPALLDARQPLSEVGLDSLMAVQLRNQVLADLGTDLPLRTILGGATIGELARYVEASRHGTRAASAPALVRVSRDGALPLSFAQQRIWFLDRLEPGPAYVLAYALRLAGPLNVPALRQSLNQVVARHETLRTRFPEVDGQPRQIVVPALEVPIPVEDLSGMAEDERDAEVRRRAAEEARRPFALAEGPLLRARLIRLGGDHHVLLLALHHIAVDGWSLQVLFRELSTLYAGFRAGRPPTLPELPIQYGDFAVWQRQWLQGEVLETQTKYWARQLAGVPVLQLPTDRPRAAVQTPRGGLASSSLPPGLYRDLKVLSQREGATLFMTMLAAFQALLHRYTGQDDLAVGSPVAGRSRSEVEGLVGLFINSLVLRTDLSGDPTFRELIARVRETTLAAYAHQEVPFEKLVEELQPERNLGRNPLFQVLFEMQAPSLRELVLEGVVVSGLWLDTGAARLDLEFHVWETPEGLETTVIYDRDLFDPDTIDRWQRHLAILLEAVAADAGRRLSELPLMDADERRRVLVEWNATAQEHTRDRGIHELFEEQAARTPEAVALIAGDDRLAYRELNQRANRLARALRGMGVGPEARVGICLERSLDLAVALLGVLKAGGAYVPLDPSHPRERLAFMVEDAALSVVLTRESLLSTLPECGAPVVCVDRDRDGIAREGGDNLGIPVAPEQAAYVIYTSGSTGRPKGVVGLHMGAINRFEWMWRSHPFEGGEVCCQKTTLSFVDSVWEVFGPLLRGVPAVLIPDDVAKDPVRLVRALGEAGVTRIVLVPSLLRALLEGVADLPRKLPRLRQWVTSGEALTVELARRFRDEMPRASMINLYGSSEVAADATHCELDEVGTCVPIGRPISNMRAYVLDGSLQPSPVGTEGELYLGGWGLARGYLNRPDLTAERFVPDPLGDEAGGRLYRTGDRARWRGEGQLEFLGRVDQQVKVRGHRIELGEVEAALAEHPDVAQAVVAAREDASGEKRLVAYVVGRGQPISASELRRFLAGKLPESMVPAAFVALEALPLTPSGKVDRRALPDPRPGRPDPEKAFVPPRGPIEEAVAALWGEVLGLARIGAHDNFFELGGHSLNATQVVARIRDAFQIEVPLRQLFQGPTVAGLAETIASARGKEARPPAPPIRVAAREAEPSLSLAQERLWFLEQLQPGTAAYNLPGGVRLLGPLDREALRRSLEEIVRRHEAVRTAFPAAGGRPAPVIDGAPRLSLDEVDLRQIDGPAREAEVRRLAAEEAERPFDLARGPLVRAKLWRLADEEHALLVTLHHIVADGWSVGILTRELAALYGAFRAGRPSPLPDLPIRYADFASWQRDWLTGEALEGQLSYWRQRLEGVGALQLPTDHPRPAVQTFNGAAEFRPLGRELTQALLGLSQREGVTLFMALLAAFQALLGRYAGQDDIAVGSPIAGRSRTEVEGLIGFFVNTLVMRTDLSGDPTFRELLGRVKDVALGAYDHQDVPFEKVVDEVHPERDLSRTPIFEAVFALHNAPGEPLALAGLELRPLELEVTTTRFALELHVREGREGLGATVVFNRDLFDRATVARMLGHFQMLLEAAVAQPDARLSQMPLLDGAAEREVLSLSAGADVADAFQPVQAAFAAQAARSPEALAVDDGRTRLTYGELDRRSNQLAQLLRRVGVGPGVVVGICTERSAEMILAQLGVLKARGAYLPMDPDHPPERLAFMAEDSRVPVLLTMGTLRSRLPVGLARTVALDEDWPEIARESEDPPAAPTTAGDLAYVIYTSGSTGRPKGVEVEHGGLANLVAWHRRAYDVRAGDRATLVASPAFDASVWEVWPYLASGASLRVPDEETRVAPPRLLSWLEQERATHCFLPTPLAEAVLRDPGIARLSLRYLLTGGDRLHRIETDRLPFVLVNHYGPTENSVVATGGAVEPGTPADPPIGRPIDNTQAYVLDERLRPVPRGLPGELFIGGNGLARGYLNRPELSAESFLPNPFARQPGQRLYRTGDRVRYRGDGALEFLGRRDGQVKVRGFRVELGEIEAVLGRHPAVRERVVIVRDDQPGDKRVVAYWVAEAGRAASAGELRAYLQDRLPSYMVPSAFVTLPALPLSPNGKVDRRALPPPAASGDGSASYEAPRTESERMVAEIWKQVLRRERVGVHDNFFDLGGDSILSIQIIARARGAGLSLTPKQLFQHQTVAELAAVAGPTGEIDAEQGRVAGASPLTPIQRWFFEQELAEPHHYNQAALLEVEPGIDPVRLERAVSHLQEHHDVLRSRFERSEEGWRQAVPAEAPVPFSRLDLRSVPEKDRPAAIEAAADEVQRSLDLAGGPIWRVALMEMGGGPDRLLIVIHHLVVDGVSWRVLVEDLQTACAQLSRGERVQLPRKTTSFARWAERLEQYSGSEELGREVEHWRAAGSGSEPLPVDLPGGARTESLAATVSVELDPDQTRALLQEVPGVYHTHIPEVLLSAVLEAFREWTGRDTLRLDVEGHGREGLFDGVDLSRTVGWFTTIWPARLQWVDGGPGELLKAVKEQLRAVPQRGIGYGLLRYVSRDGGLREQPAAEASFNYLGQFDQVFGAKSLFGPAPESPGGLRSPLAAQPYLIQILGAVSGGRLRLAWTYGQAFHRRDTIERLAGSFLASLQGLIAHCQSPGAGGCTASDFPLARVDQARLERLLDGGRDVEDIYPLSPMQQGLLFHTLMSPRSGMYFEQLTLSLAGPLDAAALRTAWQEMVGRHAVLRTRFAWEGLDAPLQVVERHVELAWEEHDWSRLPSTEQEERLRRLLASDRGREFDLSRAPLTRLALVQMAEDDHRLVWSFHHLLLDGWSLPVVVKEVLRSYQAHTRGNAPELAPVAPYRDYITWLAGQDLAKTEAYWRSELAGFRAPTPLAVDLRMGTAAGLEGEVGEQNIQLSAAGTERLRTLARRHQLTLNTLVQGAWGVLLSRYSGEDDVVFGATVSGRPAALPTVEAMVGLFINTLPVRVKVAPDQALVPWLRSIQERQVEQRQYEHSALAQVQAWSEVPAGQPLFESLLAFENYPVEPPAGQGAAGVRVVGAHFAERTNYPLTVTAVPGSRLSIGILYDRQRFAEEAVGRMLRHVATLLEGMAARPEAPVSDLPMMTAGERSQALVEWNATARPYPRQSIPQVFEAAAAAAPHAVAVVFARERLTYGELNRRANQLAHRLRGLGVGPSSRVGICLERSLEMVVGLLGILKAGGAYVPLDVSYPPERLAFMVEDAALSVLVTQERLRSKLPMHGATVVLLDVERERLAQESAGNPASGVVPEDLAYVTYTSGSTGVPKGVEVTHRGVLRLLFGVDYVELGPEARVLQMAPVSFDASTLEIWGALLHGGRCVVFPERVPTAFELGEVIETEGVDTMWLTASLFNAIVEEAPEALGGVRQLLIGGEALSVPHVRQGLERLPGTRIINGYGPTESTTFTCCYEIPRPLPEWAKSIPIGRPISNTRVYVLDGRMQPVPVGVAGELFIGGDGLARGYLGRPELTAERFVPDPFAQEVGGRLYRTGDLVRYLSEGRIEFLGRADHQVKVHGYRIELGEVEAALADHAGVRHVAVVMKGGPTEKRLVAYVVPAEAAPAAADLRAYAKGRLPDYMVPSAFVTLDALPLSPNGKVDRRALASRPEEGAPPEQAYEEPRTRAEQTLTRIWGEVLGVARVGIRDNFFELGGDSILSIQIVARAREAGMRLSLKQIFEHPTVAELVAVAGAPVGSEAAEQGRVAGEAPLTPIQRWFFAQGLPEPHHYNQAVLLDVRRELDPSWLEQAVSGLQEHHDALRTRFTRGSQRWRQEVAAEAAVPFARVDLRAVAEPERPAALDAAAEEAQRNLDLSAGPLWRVVLFDLGDGGRKLLVVIHHLVVDGVSWRVLLEDLQAACAQLASGDPVRLPRKTTSFRRWAERLREYAVSEDLAREREHWHAVGEGFEPLPVDLAAGEDTAGSAATVTVELDPDETRALLQDVPGVYHTQITEVLLTAATGTLRKWTGRDTVLFDLEGHGREELFEGVDLSRTVGWFTTIYPVRLRWPGGGVGEALKGIKEQLRAVPRRGIGFGLLRWTSEGGEELRGAAAQVSFNYLGQFDQVLGDSSWFGLEEPRGRAQSPLGQRPHPLAISAAVSGGRLRVAWTYSEARHRRPTVETLARGFLEELRGLVAHCQSPGAGGHTASDFPLAQLDQPTLDAVLAGQRDVQDLYPLSPMQQGLLFHSLLSPRSGLYFEQLRLSVDGPLDRVALRKAWQRVVDRHGILRTRFAWEGSKEPLQVVERAVALPWQELDWRGLSGAAQEERLAAWLDADRRRGFDVAQAPLMRLALIRTAEASCEMVWSFHHLLLDGWSLPLVMKELLRLYQALAQGRPLELGEVPPYRDYVRWLRQQDLPAAERYWRKELAGFRVPTKLAGEPGADAREAGEAAPDEQKAVLSAAATAALHAFGRRHQLTLNTMVQGAWGLLLGRHSGEDDVVFGVTASGRPAALPGVESMVGLFVNTLPMRLRVSDGQPVLEWLKNLQARQVEQRQYEYSPLVEVQAWSDVPSGQPLFESLLVFENYPVDASGLREWAGPLDIRSTPISERTNYPLTVLAVPGPRLSLQINHDRRRFPAATVTRMLSHLTTLLEDMASRPDADVSQLRWLTDAERHQVLAGWNETGTEGSDRSIHARFEEQVERTPQAVALRFGDEGLVYQDLNRRANRLARRLRHLGAGSESRVGICLERSPDMVVALLAVLKSGGAYVPLDPKHPAARLGFVLEDSRPAVVLTREELLPVLPSLGARTLCLDRDAPEVASESGENLGIEAAAGQAAYVIYTSGSTGQPKGVVGLHGGAVNRFEWMWSTYPFEADEVCCQKTTLSFVDSVWEVFGPLLRGVPSVLIGEEEARDPFRLVEELARRGVTRIVLVPSLLRALLDGVGDLQGRLPRLRYWVTSGEALPPELARRFVGAMPGARLINLYGSSEAAADATHCEVRDAADAVPIGRPITNMRAYVLDRGREPVAVGVAGELHLSGAGLARGYLHRPELTAEKFLPDPFAREPGGRLYRTGDWARWREDGQLEFLGRVDQQVKVRGHRIEPGEIEAALVQHAGVRQAVVVAREDAVGEKSLVAYVVAAEAPLSASHLRAFLGRRLPEYMVPAHFLVIDALPLTPSGKVDRKALPEPGAGRPPVDDGFVPPRNSLEEAVAAVWAEVLGLERVGAHDDFFELGGHSLKAAQVVSRLRAAFGVELSLGRIFEARRLEHLAAAIEEALVAEIDGIGEDEAKHLLHGPEAESRWANEQR
jgi:amino acid adenylation domain-containing protein/non-ribosomal peptide synthase protein (TIGR01720 family)